MKPVLLALKAHDNKTVINFMIFHSNMWRKLYVIHAMHDFSVWQRNGSNATDNNRFRSHTGINLTIKYYYLYIDGWTWPAVSLGPIPSPMQRLKELQSGEPCKFPLAKFLNKRCFPSICLWPTNPSLLLQYITNNA